MSILAPTSFVPNLGFSPSPIESAFCSSLGPSVAPQFALADDSQALSLLPLLNSLTTLLMQLMLTQGATEASNFAPIPPTDFGTDSFSGGSSKAHSGHHAAGAHHAHGSDAVNSNSAAQDSAPPMLPSGPLPDKVKNFIKKAESHRGAPYVFGASGRGRYDCSGLIYASLNEAGVKVPRTTADGYMRHYAHSRVSRSQLKPGDLVFYHYTNSRGIGRGHASHIEIYIGNGKTMGTDNPREGARIEPVDWKHFIGGARVPELYR